MENIILNLIGVMLGLTVATLIIALIIWGAGSFIISIFNIAYNLTFLKSLAISVGIVAIKSIFGRGKNNG